MASSHPAASARFPLNTRATLIALALGLAAGAAAQWIGDPRLKIVADLANGLGGLWASALRVVVVPMVVCMLVVGLAGTSGKLVGKIGARSFATYIALLVAGGTLTLLLAPALLRLFDVPPNVMAGASAAKPATTTLGGIFNLEVARSVLDNDLLPIIAAAIVFALALTRVEEGPRQKVLDVFDGLLRAMFVVMSWILTLLPAAVFALAYAIAARSGFAAGRAFASFVLMVILVLLVYTAGLYPVAVTFGRVTLARFARAAVPAQTMAISTRSSIASLPALLESGERLGLPAEINSFSMPLSVSIFKANRTISGTVKLFFLAWICGVELAPATIAAYILTLIAVSFASPGTPSAGLFTSTAPLLAAGIPMEAIVLIHAVDDLPDIVKTVTNVTADLVVAAIVTRFSGMAVAAEDETLESVAAG